MPSSPQDLPLVSVCVPAYNVGRFVKTALESLLAQTHRHIEVIVIDDGSKDNTREVLHSFTDPRLQVVENESNIGGFQSMNKAIQLAQGELLAVYHSDDYYDTRIIEKEVNFLMTHPEAAAVFSMDKFMDFNGHVYSGLHVPREYRGRTLFAYDFVFPFLLRNKNILFRCPTFMARRSTLEKIGLFDGERFGIAADLDLWIRILRWRPIGILDEQLMHYRFGDQQWSRRYKKLRTSQELYFDIMDHYLETDQWRNMLHPDDLVEYDFHRCADETFRSLNHVRLGNLSQAKKLLNRPFPWRTLFVSTPKLYFRKLALVLKRFLLKTALAVDGGRLLLRLINLPGNAPGTGLFHNNSFDDF